MNKYQYKVQGVDYDVEIEEVEGNVAKVSVNGIPFEVEMKQPIKAAPKPHKPTAPAHQTQEPAPVAQNPTPKKTAAPQAAGGNPVKAPLPGTITEVKVNVGDEVKAGQVVVVLEAMKMQNDIECDYDGVVKSVSVGKGDTVMEGTVMLTIG